MTPEVAKSVAEAGPWAVVILIGGALAVGFTRAIVVLWRNHLEADLDDRTQRNLALGLLDKALDGNREAAAGSKSMAAAWDERNRIDAERNRSDAARKRRVDP